MAKKTTPEPVTVEPNAAPAAPQTTEQAVPEFRSGHGGSFSIQPDGTVVPTEQPAG
jgi:hypothetical protein